ncbi:hypothetical protein KDI_54300 [Dictyobacter arantiisoli]|uniref:Peptidase S53 domain-containing protein n=1 Tax=Dictyobacter arantiisoli TaxID=2014874 RepID=A0A5A5TL68_9CHLR|nr:hypothetical protein KDI_54300 [Dictyobacter arantiisoli]
MHAIPYYKDAIPALLGRPACLSSVKVPRCYSPAQIREAYHIAPLLKAGITGKGQTIVIIDFFQSPNLRHDLHLFDQLFGLPDPVLTIHAPNGLVPFDPKDPAQVISADEINLDVEWAHAIAPAARIDLVLSRTQSYGDLYNATRYAIQQNRGGVLSQSFGFPETGAPEGAVEKEHALFVQARARGITVFASSGDRGVVEPIYIGTPKKVVAIAPGVEYPASDPLVTSVGGTTLDILMNGRGSKETVWSNRYGATGGGFSRIFARPGYQKNFARTIGPTRGIPDVAYNADPTVGFPVVVTIVKGKTLIVPIGGTSAGTPQWAALVALGNQLAGRRLGFINPILYQLVEGPTYHRVLRDITVGNNDFILALLGMMLRVPGYAAAPGWDATTGLGTPIATPLIKLLASLLGIPRNVPSSSFGYRYRPPLTYYRHTCHKRFHHRHCHPCACR